MDQYQTEMARAYAGMRGTMRPASFISRTNSGAAILAFGKPVNQDTGEENSCVAYAAGQALGLVAADRGAVSGDSATPDGFGQYETVRIQEAGDIFAVAAMIVAPDDPVYIRPSNGDLQNTNANSAVLQTGWRWETATSATGELARIYLGK